VYLSAAFELRHGEPGPDTRISGAGQLLRYTPTERFFDAMAARLDGPAAEGVSLALNFVFTDLGEAHHLWIENSVLHHRPIAKGAAPPADATVKLTQDFWLRLVTGRAGVRDLVLSDEIDVDGNRADLLRFFALLEAPDPSFAIVRP